jgi:tetratricopeptide (TPR) repeat protein
LRRIRLYHISIALLLLTAALALVYREQLSWGRWALEAYLDGTTMPTWESELEVEGYELIKGGGDLEQARALFEESIAIDPNSTAVFKLGEVYRLMGDEEQALAHYRRYHALDVTYLPAYYRIAEILAARGEFDARRRLLSDGADYFREHVEQYRPRVDDSVGHVFNAKAEAVYNSYRESLAILERMLDAEP